MKSLKHISLSLLWGVVMASFISPTSQAASIFGGPEKKEMVYFFSYHCGACYESGTYLRAWSKLHPDQRIRRVPVFSGEQWRPGARLFFLLEQSKDKYPLSAFERERAAYALVSQMSSPRDEPEFYLDLLRSYGMKFTAAEFSQWWSTSTTLLQDAEGILRLTQVESEKMSVPFVRISSSDNELPVYIQLSEPTEAFPALNGVLQ